MRPQVAICIILVSAFRCDAAFADDSMQREAQGFLDAFLNYCRPAIESDKAIESIASGGLELKKVGQRKLKADERMRLDSELYVPKGVPGSILIEFKQEDVCVVQSKGIFGEAVLRVVEQAITHPSAGYEFKSELSSPLLSLFRNRIFEKTLKEDTFKVVLVWFKDSKEVSAKIFKNQE